MKRFSILLALAAAFVLPAALVARPAVPPQSNSAAVETIEARVARVSARLHPQTGDIRIPGANAVLHLGEDYYFLPADEARLVLTEGWDNPPEATTGVLGMVFPAGRTFADDTWGAVVTFQPTGYVSDSDAAETDYGELLTQMQAGDASVNAERSRLGYPAQHLVGWAQTPVYDSRTHSVVWARNIQFEGVPENTLNYDIRMLGRRGVLSLNMVAVMSKLGETRQAAQRFAAAAAFAPGERYADFQPGTDAVSEYGVAGLIAAGAGVAVAKKVGLIALILAFGKKFIILIIAGIALLGGLIRRMFGRKEEEEYHQEAPPAEYAAEPPEDAAQAEGPDNAAPAQLTLDKGAPSPR
jgi:uncharacterized membrane-anchored protein